MNRYEQRRRKLLQQEKAVKYSKEGAGINLAKYEDDLARFLRDHRNV